jgi:bifunctional enzyme CysN/CysC
MLANAPEGLLRVDRDRMYIVVVGHVDHGKSTLVGRLLADTCSLPDGKLDKVRALCRRTGHPFEYAFLLDALKDEQSQGITIDVARVFFKTPLRDYVIIDAPGHNEFLRNMVTGAARAQAALLVIDAAEGVRENSRRHATMLSLLGIDQVAVVVNKMDLVSWSEKTFRAIETDYRAFLQRLGVHAPYFVPVSGREGDFVVRRTSHAAWYDGPTVVEVIDSFTPAKPKTARPFRMPVQDVYRFTGHTGGADDRRIVAGTVVSGRISVGDEIAFLPSGKRSHVRSIEEFAHAPSPSIEAGRPAGLTLTEHIYVARGELATRAGDAPPTVSTRLRASVFWLGKTPLTPGKDYLLRLGTARVPMRVERIDSVMDASTLERATSTERERGRETVERNEVADCTLLLARPVACDVTEVLETSRFVIVDDYEIRGGGIVREAFAEHETGIGDSRPRGSVVWLTGLSGAGKTTVARAVVAKLEAQGRRVEFLDGDELRFAMPTGFSREERDAHVRRVAFLASRLEHHGVTVVVALISPYRSSRGHARSICRRFSEVYVSTSLEVCERRDVKGLYARARAGLLTQFTGVDDPYEVPEAPEIDLDTSHSTVEEAADAVLRQLGAQEA